MLKQRVITAIVLLAILLPILFSGQQTLFAIACLVFLVAGVWESYRLFQSKKSILFAVIWGAVFVFICFTPTVKNLNFFFLLSILLWVIRFTPSLFFGLPALSSPINPLLGTSYSLSILGCFLGILALFKFSPIFLLSVMVIVWISDIGAYFVGKGFGRHKLAPTISPGKSWEGAIGGWLAVLVVCVGMIIIYPMNDTFPLKVYLKFGSWGFVGIITILVIAGIVGDLFESQLKRRAGVKDSSQLLPGHGGVLDRIDALIPVLPLAAFITTWL